MGALGLIDEGEADWKILAINTRDELAASLNDIQDVKEKLPGLLDSTRDWFKLYKIPTGKPANQFALNGKFFDREFAMNLIQHTHKAWSKLLNQSNNNGQKISLLHTTLENNKNANKITSQKARELVEQRAHELNKMNAQIDRNQTEIDRVYYIDAKAY